MTLEMRVRLLSMLGWGADDYDCVPMQGSGSFSVEAMLGTFVPRDGKALILANGAYGQRAAKTMAYLGGDHVVRDKGDYLPPSGAEVTDMLQRDLAITHVIAVHCETSSGIINPLSEISMATYDAGRILLVDSMSAFGAIALEPKDIRFEAMVSSANKCIEAVPGFGFVIARTEALKAAEGNSHSLSLDVHDQWAYMQKTGQWRFTPPTHVVAAFLSALRSHEMEGGVTGRRNRYTRNRNVLVAAMRKLGFETLLDDRWLSPIIVTFFCPADPRFDFDGFYQLMKKKGFIIYPGKLTVADSFRIGCIGRIDDQVMVQISAAAEAALEEMNVVSAAPPKQAIDERAKLAA